MPTELLEWTNWVSYCSVVKKTERRTMPVTGDRKQSWFEVCVSRHWRWNSRPWCITITVISVNTLSIFEHCSEIYFQIRELRKDYKIGFNIRNKEKISEFLIIWDNIGYLYIHVIKQIFLHNIFVIVHTSNYALLTMKKMALDYTMRLKTVHLRL